MHHTKYIQHLEKKVTHLETELARYKEINKNEINHINSSSTPNNQYIDPKQIKKIEPKQINKQSTKNVNKSIDYIKTDNLNAKTAEIMRVSPNNMIVNNRPLMAVNINNTNKLMKDENSNYEKYLFKQSIYN